MPSQVYSGDTPLLMYLLRSGICRPLPHLSSTAEFPVHIGNCSCTSPRLEGIRYLPLCWLRIGISVSIAGGTELARVPSIFVGTVGVDVVSRHCKQVEPVATKIADWISNIEHSLM